MLSNKERKSKKIGYPINVIVVEDSEDDTFLLIRHLRKGGFYPRYKRVQTADGLRDALSARQWDIVLCDHHMPGFDSVAALKIVTQECPNVPFVLVSGIAQNTVRNKIEGNGGRGAITKNELHKLPSIVTREIRAARMKSNRNGNHGKSHHKSTKTPDRKSKLLNISLLTREADAHQNPSTDDSNPVKNISGESKPIKNILIVEDELIQSILLEKLVKSLGYKVIGKATKGADAIKMAMDLKPDLITMDISLQDDIDGIVATQTIQENSMIPVIYISGNSDKYNFDRAEKTQFIDFIPKPVNKETLSKSFSKAEALNKNGTS